MCLSWNSSLNELDWHSIAWKSQVPPVGPSQKVKDISLLHISIAVLKHAKEKMACIFKGDAAGWTWMKQGQNYCSSRKWFRVPLSCSFLRMKVIKLIWSSSLWPWSDFSLFSAARRSRKTLRWGLAPLRLSGRDHQPLWWWVIEAIAGKASFPLLSSILQVLILQSGKMLLYYITMRDDNI